MLNLQKIGNKISTLRKQKGITQNEMADALFVTHQAVSKWENGKSIPSIEILYEITKLFDISIDYLINDNNDTAQDYQTMFQTTSREAVLNHFYNQDNLNQEIEQIFYLLNKEERLLIINQLISDTIHIDVKTIWPLLSQTERSYLLNHIITGKLDYNLNLIITMLTPLEQQIIQKSFQNGNYPYPIYHKRR